MSEQQDSAGPTTKEKSIDQFVLLFALLVVLLVVPFFESYAADRTLLSVGFNLILLIGVILYRHKRYIFLPAVVLVTIEVPLMWLTLFLEHSLLFLVSSILASGLFAALSIALLTRVVRWHRAEVQSLFGAINAYLLLGLAWAVFYWALDRVCPDAFVFSNRVAIQYGSGSDEVTAFSQLIYFSFVTMSTLGYGDISPRLPAAQTLAWMQAVAGQFYLAVAVAWLVNTLPHGATSPADAASDEG